MTSSHSELPDIKRKVHLSMLLIIYISIFVGQDKDIFINEYRLKRTIWTSASMVKFEYGIYIITSTSYKNTNA